MQQIAMKTIEEIKKDLFEYVKENTFKETSTLTNDTKLFVEGIFDSMGFVMLLEFLEDTYSVTASDGELVEENFESIDSIADFVVTKNPSTIQGSRSRRDFPLRLRS